MATPGFEVKINIGGNLNNTEKNAAVALIEGVLLAYDANIVFTEETIAGMDVGFSWEVNYIDFQSVYGQTTMMIAMAFNRSFVLIPKVTAIEI
jgi:hypothetical protein